MKGDDELKPRKHNRRSQMRGIEGWSVQLGASVRQMIGHFVLFRRLPKRTLSGFGLVFQRVSFRFGGTHIAANSPPVRDPSPSGSTR